MSFFESEVVKKELNEINDLQMRIYSDYYKFPFMTTGEQLEHIERLEQLLEKQHILYTRLSLSDDEDAKTMKESILKTAQLLGFPSNVNMNQIFQETSKVLNQLKEQIDRMENSR